MAHCFAVGRSPRWDLSHYLSWRIVSLWAGPRDGTLAILCHILRIVSLWAGPRDGTLAIFCHILRIVSLWAGPRDGTLAILCHILRIVSLWAGPKDWTIEDMWRMVWQARTNSIVMLANLFELGKV